MSSMQCAQGVVETGASPHARLKAVPSQAVRLRPGFWQPRLEANARASIPQLYRLLEEHGVLDNFRRIYGGSQAPRRGYLFTDSDLYKWIEAASWALLGEGAPAIRPLVSEAIEAILPAQRADGYLNTYYVDERYGERYTRFASDHELYCAGHLFHAAVAHHRATGETRLLACATRFADHLCQALPALPEARPGHPEIEMALVELYRETRQQRYLDLARRLLEANRFPDYHTVAGHAVRAMYFAGGGTDYYLESGDARYLQAALDQWADLTRGKVYLTGGVGSRQIGEEVGYPYELPNAEAYAETCASIGSIMWSWRLLAVEGEPRFADQLEQTLYNGFLAAVSLDGTRYFYANPLRYDGELDDEPRWGQRAYGHHERERQPWFNCTCCPPNIERLLASLPGYFYSTSDEGLWVHLYDASELDWHLADGTRLQVQQETSYPWEGSVGLTVTPSAPAAFTLRLRIPGWAVGATARINDEAPVAAEAGRYLALARTWQPGDRVHLHLPLSPTPLSSHPRVAENRGSVALQRGPLVYCLEGHDNPGVSVRDALLDPRMGATAEYRADLLGGVTVLRIPGFVPAANEAALYRPWSAEPSALRPVALAAIPYYAWANRGRSAMTVWVRQAGH